MDNKRQQQIYDNYRMALRSSYGHRAGERKQHARVMIVDRYQISFKELKDIVTQGDEENGIKHEHTKGYLQLLEYERKFDELIQKHEKTPQACFICKTEKGTSIYIYPVKREARVYEPIAACEPCFVRLLEKSLNLN